MAYAHRGWATEMANPMREVEVEVMELVIYAFVNSYGVDQYMLQRVSRDNPMITSLYL